MTAVEQPRQDPRIKPGQCGDTTAIAGREFICIAPPHPDVSTKAEYMRVYRGGRPRSAYHFFIRRYPASAS